MGLEGPGMIANTYKTDSISQAGLVTLLTCGTFTVMAGAVIAPALPAIGEQFSSVPDVLFWVPVLLTVSGLASAISAPFWGIMSDKLGPKLILVSACALCGLGGSAGLWATKFWVVFAGRIILGTGVGGVMTAATFFVATLFEAQQRKRLLGIQVTLTYVAGVLMMIAGGLLADLNWRAPFGVYLIPLIMAPAAAAWLPEVKHLPSERAFPRARFLNQRTVLGLVCCCLLTMCFYSLVTELPAYLKLIGYPTASAGGYALAAMTGGCAITSSFYERVETRLGQSGTFVSVLLLLAVGFGLLTQAATFAQFVAASVLGGFGFGLFIPNAQLWMISLSEQANRGRALGSISSAMILGQFLNSVTLIPLGHQLGIGGVFYLSAACAVLLIPGFIFISRKQ
jgi:MFS family permease